MNDRRRTGVNEVIVQDDNGGSMRIITATAKRWQVILGALTALITLCVFIGGGVRWGVNVEIEDAVEEMAADEDSGLHLQMHDCAEEVVKPIQNELKENSEAIARLEVRQESLEKTIDDKTQAIIDEIRANRGGGG